MSAWMIAGYLWVAVWTGLMTLGAYRADEPTSHKIFGPILLGAGWPIGLPLMVFGIYSPDEFANHKTK